MNSKALRKMSTVDQYWYSVPVFLLLSQQFGQRYHNLISKLLSTETPGLEDLTSLFPSLAFGAAWEKVGQHLHPYFANVKQNLFF
jgi:hypothetical protein